VQVKVSLLRSDARHRAVTVASASATTNGDGRWSLSLRKHAVGDDRDEIIVEYSGPGAPQPHRQSILTGNGGNAYTESGWTGWIEMDNGSRASNHPPSLAFGPCFQTGVEHYAIGGLTARRSPTRFCNTKTDVATAGLSAPLVRGKAVAWSSNDNRAFSPPSGPAPNPHGALVKLTVPVGEPGSLSLFLNPLRRFFKPGGFPTCAADLARQTLRCEGLVPGRRYTLHDGSKSASEVASSRGVLSHHLAVKQGDVAGLSNGSLTITRLHVAHLHVAVKGNNKAASGGHCQPGEYYGLPPTKAPTNHQAGSLAGGIALKGEICPLNGKARGLPVAHIEQTDERSGGLTQTEVARMSAISIPDGAAVNGSFIARARSMLAGRLTRDRIALEITRPGRSAFRTGNVDTTRGVRVRGLAPGAYQATWILTDANGDTRTIVTRFSELQ
jgi:hypothetical protein